MEGLKRTLYEGYFFSSSLSTTSYKTCVMQMAKNHQNINFVCEMSN